MVKFKLNFKEKIKASFTSIKVNQRTSDKPDWAFVYIIGVWSRHSLGQKRIAVIKPHCSKRLVNTFITSPYSSSTIRLWEISHISGKSSQRLKLSNTTTSSSSSSSRQAINFTLSHSAARYSAIIAIKMFSATIPPFINGTKMTVINNVYPCKSVFYLLHVECRFWSSQINGRAILVSSRSPSSFLNRSSCFAIYQTRQFSRRFPRLLQNKIGGSWRLVSEKGGLER